ncbi:MAG: HTH domain-containing protein [Bacteroidia bacterium]
MDIVDKLKRIQYIDFLITSKSACSVDEISAKLKTSRRQVINNLNLMKDLGAPLKYCKKRKHYYFEENKKFSYKYE